MSMKQPGGPASQQWAALVVVVVLIIGFGLVYTEVRRLGTRVDSLARENEALGTRIETLLASAPTTPPARPTVGDYDGPPPDGPPPGAPGDPADQFANCTARLSREEIDATIADSLAEIRRCSAANPEVAGTLNLDLLLDREGAINGARVSGGVEDRALLECLMSIWRESRFAVEDGEECTIAPLVMRFPIGEG